MFRAAIGPYTLMAWAFVSKVDGERYFSGVVMEGGNVVFRTESMRVSGTERYGALRLRNDGVVRLASEDGASKPLPESRHTGYGLELVDPGTGERWEFEMEYTRCVYWFAAGTEGRLGGFVGAIKGGLVGGPQYSGRSSGTAMEKS